MVNKSVEPDITAWANRQLEKNGLKFAREQSVIDNQITKALTMEPSKHGGLGGGRPDTHLLISNGAIEIPVIIEYKGKKGALEYSRSGLVKLKNDDNSYDFKKAIPNYAVNGAAYYASVILRHTNYKEVLCVGVNGYDAANGERVYEIKSYVINKINYDLPIFVGKYSDLSFLYKENQEALIEKIEDSQIDPDELHKKSLLDDERLDGVLANLNNYLRNETKIRTGQRIFIVAACIMAGLGVKDDNGQYLVSPLRADELIGSNEEGETDGEKINRKVKSFLKAKKLPSEKQRQIDNALKQVILFSNLSQKGDNKNISPLRAAYEEISTYVIPAYKMAGTLDFTGKLFNVMNQWVDVPDGDTNDVVLTPRYVTNLMARLTEVDMNSYVWDWALGSGGFLISAMNLMIADARKRKNSPDSLKMKLKSIKDTQLLGIEKLPDIYILAILNMILMGDGSANIGNENSLTQYDGNYIYDKDAGKFPANVFLLNPPYSAEGNGMIFVETALKKMNSGRAAVIIQDSAGNGKSTEINKKILQNNKLLASIKMPGDLFNSGVQTSIYLFEVGKQHSQSDMVKFVNFTNDGFKRNFRKKAKHHLKDDGSAKARYDDLVNVVVHNGIKKSKYLNDDNLYIEDQIDPLSGNDWNFEKHIHFDTKPTNFDFESSIGKYISWQVNNRVTNSQNNVHVDQSNWKEFKASKLFSIEKVKGINKSALTKPSTEANFDYVTRTSVNRGVLRQSGPALNKNRPAELNLSKTFSLGLLQMTFFYREKQWYAGQYVRKIVPKFEIDRDIGLFFEILFNKQSKILSSELVSEVDSRFKNLDLLLPVDDAGNIDFERIRSIMKNIRKQKIKMIEQLLD